MLFSQCCMFVHLPLTPDVNNNIQTFKKKQPSINNAKLRFAERKRMHERRCMKMTTSIQIVCKYNESMQRLHPLKHSAAAAAALQGAVTEEELDFIADPEI